MYPPHLLGRLGEALAAGELERQGWLIIGRNFRFGHREIDLIARRSGLVAFFEVKTRTDTIFGHPLEAVTPAKRRDVERVARAWIARHGLAADAYRFDVVSIVWDGAGPPLVEHVENAWFVGE